MDFPLLVRSIDRSECDRTSHESHGLDMKNYFKRMRPQKLRQQSILIKLPMASQKPLKVTFNTVKKSVVN